jgi:hypothetical protein
MDATNNDHFNQCLYNGRATLIILIRHTNEELLHPMGPYSAEKSIVSDIPLKGWTFIRDELTILLQSRPRTWTNMVPSINNA